MAERRQGREGKIKGYRPAKYRNLLTSKNAMCQTWDKIENGKEGFRGERLEVREEYYKTRSCIVYIHLFPKMIADTENVY